MFFGDTSYQRSNIAKDNKFCYKVIDVNMQKIHLSAQKEFYACQNSENTNEKPMCPVNEVISDKCKEDKYNTDNIGNT